MPSMNIPSADTLQSFEKDITNIRDEFLAKVGQRDANYIRRVIRVQRIMDLSARLMIVLGFVHWGFWVFGVFALGIAKILDNMEIGHNVMHGQYDWMNDPHINSRTYEWDNMGDGASWKRYHNHEHHTYTNIIGKDRDYGYGLLRLSNDLPWRPKNVFQVFYYALLSIFFEWGVAYHEVAAERIFFGKKRDKSTLPITREQLKGDFFRKIRRQVVKDYIIWPLLCFPVFFSVLLGNFCANVIRNLWTSTIIFCGHFTEDAHTFSQKECENETRGQWYYRQILGSSNLEGSKVFHILTGHLSCQVEHHLFPDVPARHYPEMAKQVAEVCKKHDIPYNTGSFLSQYLTVLKRVIRYSFPGGLPVRAEKTAS